MEIDLKTRKEYANPFLDVVLDGRFSSPSGKEYRVPGFYDGDGGWEVRFSPAESGRWQYETFTQLADGELCSSGSFDVTEPEIPCRGFLRTCPGKHWGLQYESGEPCFIWGDTVYNLFGMAYCGLEYESFLRRRAEQGFNIMRARLPVSPFHPPDGHNDWQTRSTWPWGGSPQKPLFDRFNLGYFQAVDSVMRLAQQLGMGFEMIMEAWGMEYPFNCRVHFTPEYEELWMRYLIARYDAFQSVYVWTLMNEYEYYPDGKRTPGPAREANLWAVRMGRYVKSTAPHGHPVAVHIFTPSLPGDQPLAQRFWNAPGVIDLVMFQHWGNNRGGTDARLAAGIEQSISRFLEGWEGASIFAEYGYERNPALALKLPSHEHMGPEHTRRAAWRGVFCAQGVMHGFENTWGPWWMPDEDLPGMQYLHHLRKLFAETVEFHRLRPESGLIFDDGPYAEGERPLCMASAESAERDTVLVYLPVGGQVTLALAGLENYEQSWFDPRTGGRSDASGTRSGSGTCFTAPTTDRSDCTLILRKRR